MKFFVSYSRSVQDKVREIIVTLRDTGDEVWWDQDLQAGQDWWGTILNNIDACEVCLFMISEKSVQSPYCMQELRYALDRNRLVLPYVMDGPPTYTIPPEIMQGRIQYEIYNGVPNQLKHRIRVTCQSVDWDQYRNRYTARPAEPNTGSNDLVDRLDKAVALANEGHFDEAIKGFKDVSRNDPDSYGDFCHTWLDKINRYRDVVKHAAAPALKSLAKQRWEAFLQQYPNDDVFDPLHIHAKLAEIPMPKKRTGLLSMLQPPPVPTPPDDVTRWKSFAGKHNSDWRPYISPLKDLKIPDMAFCLVPPGTFQMGSNEESDERPIHPQTLPQPYWIGRYPVTNAQWQVAVRAGVVKEPEEEQALRWYQDAQMGQAPVVGVTWFAAKAFCEWMGCRLPTEREWEYAARGVDSLMYPWGNEWNESVPARGQKTGGRPNEVTSRPEGEAWVGALHMSGNVWEWTSSLKESYPYVANDGREADTGDRNDVLRVLRGGSWDFTYASFLRSSLRDKFNPASLVYVIGFRCVCPYV